MWGACSTPTGALSLWGWREESRCLIEVEWTRASDLLDWGGGDGEGEGVVATLTPVPDGWGLLSTLGGALGRSCVKRRYILVLRHQSWRCHTGIWKEQTGGQREAGLEREFRVCSIWRKSCGHR